MHLYLNTHHALQQERRQALASGTQGPRLMVTAVLHLRWLWCPAATLHRTEVVVTPAYAHVLRCFATGGGSNRLREEHTMQDPDKLCGQAAQRTRAR